MQDLIRYNGYSIFCYCIPCKPEGWKANITIQDIMSKALPEEPIELDAIYLSQEIAIVHAKDYGKGLVDRRADKNSQSDIDTDLNDSSA